MDRRVRGHTAYNATLGRCPKLLGRKWLIYNGGTFSKSRFCPKSSNRQCTKGTGILNSTRDEPENAKSFMKSALILTFSPRRRERYRIFGTIVPKSLLEVVATQDWDRLKIMFSSQTLQPRMVNGVHNSRLESLGRKHYF